MLLLFLVLLLSACGKKREIDPEEVGVPNVTPREQILYREARSTIERWLRIFESETESIEAYALLTYRSRMALKQMGVASKEQFPAWFAKQRVDNRIPFAYRISRLDILDIDFRDTNRAVITASFLIALRDEERETIGSFFLLREHGKWKIPFADQPDFIRAWWQLDKGLSFKVKEEGLENVVSKTLDISFLAPIAWDKVDNATFTVPSVSGQQRGIELSYLDPTTVMRDVLVRIYSQPAPIPDTTQAHFHFIDVADASLTEESAYQGKLYRYLKPGGREVLFIFAGTRLGSVPFQQYAQTIKSILESLQPSSTLSF